MGDNPLLGLVDADTVSRTKEMLSQALRPVRIRLVNRIGANVPLSITRCEITQLGALRRRLVADEVRLLARIEMQPSGAGLLMGLDTGLLFRMIGLLLGEGSPHSPVAVTHRPFTAADKRIAGRLIEDLVAGLQEGLPSAASSQTLKVLEITDDPNVDLGLPSTTSMIDVALEVGDPEGPLGTAILSIPSTSVRVLMPDVAPKPAASDPSGRGMARVLPIRVDAVAELARVKTSVSKLEHLAVGDLLPIGRPRSIEVRVRDRVALVAEPGVSDSGSRCIRVIRNVLDLEQAV